MFLTNNLKHALYIARMSKGELSRRCGITTETINSFFRGKTPKVSTVCAMASALGVPVSYFFTPLTASQEATASGAGSGATNSGQVRINNYATASADSCAQLSPSSASDTIAQLRKIISLYERIHPDLKDESPQPEKPSASPSSSE